MFPFQNGFKHYRISFVLSFIVFNLLDLRFAPVSRGAQMSKRGRSQGQELHCWADQKSAAVSQGEFPEPTKQKLAVRQGAARPQAVKRSCVRETHATLLKGRPLFGSAKRCLQAWPKDVSTQNK